MANYGCELTLVLTPVAVVGFLALIRLVTHGASKWKPGRITNDAFADALAAAAEPKLHQDQTSPLPAFLSGEWITFRAARPGYSSPERSDASGRARPRRRDQPHCDGSENRMRTPTRCSNGGTRLGHPDPPPHLSPTAALDPAIRLLEGDTDPVCEGWRNTGMSGVLPRARLKAGGRSLTTTPTPRPSDAGDVAGVVPRAPAESRPSKPNYNADTKAERSEELVEAAGVELEHAGAANQLMARDFCCYRLVLSALKGIERLPSLPHRSSRVEQILGGIWRGAT